MIWLRSTFVENSSFSINNDDWLTSNLLRNEFSSYSKFFNLVWPPCTIEILKRTVPRNLFSKYKFVWSYIYESLNLLCFMVIYYTLHTKNENSTTPQFCVSQNAGWISILETRKNGIKCTEIYHHTE